MALVGGGVVEGVQEAGAVHRFLVDAVDAGRLGQADRLQHRRRDVDAVSELVANSLVRRDPAGPGNHHRIPCPAEMAGHLLAPLERCVVGVRPGRGKVRGGVLVAERFDSAVLFDQLQLVVGIEDDAVQKCHLVERPGDGALHAGAVVAPDVEDQGVVQLAQVFDRIEQPSHVPVGILGEAGEHLHLAGVELFWLSDKLSQAGKRLGRSVNSVSGGTMPSFICRSSVCWR